VRVAGNDIRPVVAQVQEHVEEMQADAGHQHRGNRHQQHLVAARVEPGTDQRALVPAEQALDAPERDRVDVPGVAGEISDAGHAAVVRRVETVVHARSNAQGRVSRIAMGGHQAGIAEQVVQRVGKALGLQHLLAVEPAAGADDRVAGAGEYRRVRIDRARARLEFADEAVMQAGELRFLCLLQAQVGEAAPDPDRQRAHQRLLDLAEPAHEAGEQLPRNAVGQQEIDVFLLQDAQHRGAHRHGPVTLS
jgi:hypothetical protein